MDDIGLDCLSSIYLSNQRMDKNMEEDTRVLFDRKHTKKKIYIEKERYKRLKIFISYWCVIFKDEKVWTGIAFFFFRSVLSTSIASRVDDLITNKNDVFSPIFVIDD